MLRGREKQRLNIRNDEIDDIVLKEQPTWRMVELEKNRGKPWEHPQFSFNANDKEKIREEEGGGEKKRIKRKKKKQIENRVTYFSFRVESPRGEAIEGRGPLWLLCCLSCSSYYMSFKKWIIIIEKGVTKIEKKKQEKKRRKEKEEIERMYFKNIKLKLYIYIFVGWIW